MLLSQRRVLLTLPLLDSRLGQTPFTEDLRTLPFASLLHLEALESALNSSLGLGLPPFTLLLPCW